MQHPQHQHHAHSMQETIVRSSRVRVRAKNCMGPHGMYNVHVCSWTDACTYSNTLATRTSVHAPSRDTDRSPPVFRLRAQNPVSFTMVQTSHWRFALHFAAHAWGLDSAAAHQPHSNAGRGGCQTCNRRVQMGAAIISGCR